MERRAFITLFTTATVAALADPSQARSRRRARGRGARIARGRRTRRGDRIARRSTTYQAVSYQPRQSRKYQPISTGVSVQAQQRKNVAPINRNLPEFWRSPGEIDRLIVAGIRNQDIQGLTRRQLIQKYGVPNQEDSGSITWNVGRTTDGIIAPQTFTIYLNNGKASHFQRGF